MTKPYTHRPSNPGSDRKIKIAAAKAAKKRKAGE
jgi:hypothetical protein